MGIYIYSVDDICIQFPWTAYKSWLIFENARTAHSSHNAMAGSIFLVAVEGQGVPASTALHSQMLGSAPVLHELIQIKKNPFVSVFVFFTMQVPKTITCQK